jgi:hypothetical protein
MMLKSPFAGQNTKAAFEFDYRNTQSPFIGEGFMDLYFLGELLYVPGKGMKKDEHGSEFIPCTLQPDAMGFLNTETFSQLVITESAFTCMLNSISQSPIGKLHLNA